MQKPKIDDKLKLLTDFGETEAICAEVLDNPGSIGGVLLKVMARGPFEEGQQCWILDRDGSKIGCKRFAVLTPQPTCSTRKRSAGRTTLASTAK